jgi:small-conductance mechanosensitive channel
MASFYRKSAFFAAASLAMLPSLPSVLADDNAQSNQSAQHSSRTVIESTRSLPNQPAGAVVTESSETADGSVKKLFVPKFQQRLNNLKEQLERGITKGWLTTEQAERFKQQHEKAAALEADVRAKGYPKDAVDNLEKEVTALNDTLSQALIKGSTPAPEKPAASPAPTGQSAKSPAKEAASNPSAKSGGGARPQPATAKKPVAAKSGPGKVKRK